MVDPVLKSEQSFDPSSNPIGTDGFEFVEYAAADPSTLQRLFDQLGFAPVARHRTKNILRYNQGNVNFIINAEPNSHAAGFQQDHGPCAASMGFRVKNAEHAFNELIARGAKPFEGGNGTFDVPAITGIGNSLIYLIDQYEDSNIYDTDFEPLSSPNTESVGLIDLDHLTHNVYQGNMDHWADFYVNLFNFHQIRFFDIEGQKTGLISRAMSSPCGKIRIPLNESKDDVSQIEEYLREYRGEGIQHIAFTTDNIYETVTKLQNKGIKFLQTPDTYYEMLEDRLPGHGEPLGEMQSRGILIDGDTSQPGKPTLLQIFTETVIGPIFFEIIQRKGHQGFGEGNFTALFEAIELDQMRRGVL
ncbi:MAG: 4-hydroxyphenylpyruvate dioxygenase [Alphaproteobacteria bacterium]